ncbi:MAG: 1-deoxy-D-xylulose-5-phosphate reductoisomerase [bacterium]
MKKNISILGSTGSIGRQTLEVISASPNRFKIIGLAAKDNLSILAEQIKKFSPKIVSVDTEASAAVLQEKLGKTQTVIYFGSEGLIKVSSHKEVDTVVVAIPGSAGIIPTIEAIKLKKNIALASKEVLVAAGDIVMKDVAKKKVRLTPIDSEHSGIVQCLKGEDLSKIKRVILTASGGPFLSLSSEKLSKVSVSDALAHPKWRMGDKISVDSATLMNKGFEVIEAHHLFGLDYSKIDVVVHPQSTIHSMVEFADGSIIAQMSAPDMRMPIQYALLDGERMQNKFDLIDLSKIGALTFEAPDREKFPCLELAYAAGKRGGTLPAVLNAANNEAVRLFLEERIKFTDIPRLVEQAMEKHFNTSEPNLEEIMAADLWAKKEIITGVA